MGSWYRKQLEEEYGAEYVQKTDEATIRMQSKEGPSFGPTGDCPKCDGPLVYLFNQQVHYCAMCDIELPDRDGVPFIGDKEVTIMSESSLPEEAQKLPTLDIPDGGDLDLRDQYIRIEGTRCRRCNGTEVDPDGEYPCLLCRGRGIEKFLGGKTKLMCVKHTDTELVNIGKRHVSWEDSQGFDHKGYLAVRGCPVCKVPVLSILFG